MENLQAILKQHDTGLNYQMIHQDQALQKLCYAGIHITHEQTPFDYIDSIWFKPNGNVMMSIFIEPVGNIGFKAENLESLFKGLNTFFNSQPKHTTYAVAGHQIYQYCKKIRKGYAIDFRYLNPNDVWSISLDEEEEKETLAFDQIIAGSDLYAFIKQGNRVPVGILEGIYVGGSVEDAMMGEIIYVEKMMPDFFKVLIDFSHFEQHNQKILQKSKEMGMTNNHYPKNQLIETYISYEENIKKAAVVQLLRAEEIETFQQEAMAFWDSGFDGDFLEYRKK